jgi:hypothetical protein
MLENLGRGDNILAGTPLGKYLVDQDSNGRILRRGLRLGSAVMSSGKALGLTAAHLCVLPPEH